MDEYTFKHCPKGHYYQGDECPYCKAQSTPLNEISRLDISWTQHTHRGSYGISGIPDFDYKSKIEIGYIEFTGSR